MENKDKALPTAEEMYPFYCEKAKYGRGFCQFPCGMCKSPSIHTADLEARLKEKEEEFISLCKSYQRCIEENGSNYARGNALAELLEKEEKRNQSLQDENERLKKAAEGLIMAWESLPGGQTYSTGDVQRWLMNEMKPAVDNLRDVTG